MDLSQGLCPRRVAVGESFVGLEYDCPRRACLFDLLGRGGTGRSLGGDDEKPMGDVVVILGVSA